jgi:glycolate oxidase FAD binding subunit
LLGGSATAQDSAPEGWSAYPWSLAATGDDRATALKLTFALSGLADVLAAARTANVPVDLRGSAGAGVVYGAIGPGGDVGAAVDALRSVCARHGGSLVVLDAPDNVKQDVDTWGPVGGLNLMRRVKDQFDPDHRLAPGRFVGGI